MLSVQVGYIEASQDEDEESAEKEKLEISGSSSLVYRLKWIQSYCLILRVHPVLLRTLLDHLSRLSLLCHLPLLLLPIPPRLRRFACVAVAIAAVVRPGLRVGAVVGRWKVVRGEEGLSANGLVLAVVVDLLACSARNQESVQEREEGSGKGRTMSSTGFASQWEDSRSKPKT